MKAAFRVGTWHVEPRQRLIRNGAGSRRLEPKSMAVLWALVEARGQPVSRDALIDAAWDGRVVSDDAVNRQVAKLRQALGDDPRAPRYIETIPKTGFRLLAEVSFAEPATPSTADPPRGTDSLGLAAGERTGRRNILASLSLAAAGLVILVLVFGSNRDAGTAPEDLRQITSSPGVEIHPSPSPSGSSVVYAARAPQGLDYDLFVDDPAHGVPVPLVAGPGHQLHPAWSPDGERIAYLHVQDEACEIRLVTLYRQDIRTLISCRQAHDGNGLGWAPDGELLYFADRDAGGPFSIRRLHVATGVTQEVLAPVPGTVGDTTPRVAADGRVAFLRVRTLGVEDAYLLTNRGEARRITFDGGKIHGLAWYDGDPVVASNRHGGLFGLWRVDDAGLSRLAAPPGADTPGATGRGSVLAFEHWSSQVDLWWAPLGGAEPRPLIGSTRWDWWPTLSPDGTRLAWTSDRSGAAEVWIADADGSGVRRLTRFQGPYTQAAVWSPDGAVLVVAAPVAGQFDLFEIDADSGATRALTRTTADEAAPVFRPDGALMFRRDLPDGPVLVDLAGNVAATAVRRALFGPDGVLWFVRPAEPGLWRMRAGRAERVTAALETVDWQNWWVDEEGVHLVVRPHPDRPRLARVDPGSHRIQVVRELPDMFYGSGLARRGDGVVYAREMRHESDIYTICCGGAAPPT